MVFTYHDCLNNSQNNYPKNLTNQYIISKELGSGSFGVTNLAFCRKDYGPRAIKMIRIKDEKNLEDLRKEIAMLVILKHECMIRLQGVETCRCDDGSFYACIVMEFANEGEMPKDRLPEQVRVALRLLKQFHICFIKTLVKLRLFFPKLHRFHHFKMPFYKMVYKPKS